MNVTIPEKRKNEKEKHCYIKLTNIITDKNKPQNIPWPNNSNTFGEYDFIRVESSIAGNSSMRMQCGHPLGFKKLPIYNRNEKETVILIS